LKEGMQILGILKIKFITHMRDVNLIIKTCAVEILGLK